MLMIFFTFIIFMSRSFEVNASIYSTESTFKYTFIIITHPSTTTKAALSNVQPLKIVTTIVST